MHLFLICSFFVLSKTSSRKLLQNASLKCHMLLASPICCTVPFLFLSFFPFLFCFILLIFFIFFFVIEVVLSLFTGCCEKYHTSDCFYQCNYISCVYFGNLKACLGMQQNSKQLSDVSEISSRSHMVVEAYIIYHLTITNRLNLALSFFVLMHNFFFNV